ncbi:MAG: M48 family metalloprotease [Bauldia sp.]|nr:M48 family metalloprotease [Bauldia sp.]
MPASLPLRAGAGRLPGLGLLVLLAACSPLGGGAGDVSVTTTSAPSASFPVSEQHDRIVANYGGVYRDAELERTLARIVGRLVAASDDPGRSYAITILNSSSVNAFALPEGYLYVTRGLLTLATDSSEVAAVLAHEMAHVTADHAAQRQNQALTAAIVDNVVQDAVAGGPGAQIAVATSQRTLASFSQQQELEADAIGIRTVARAGYDPFAASRFLQAMAAYERYRNALNVNEGDETDFLASHPSNPQRISLAASVAQQYGPPGTGEVDRDRYLDGLDGIVFGDDAAQGFVRGLNFYHTGLGIGFAVSPGFSLDNTQAAVLAVGPEGMALRFDATTLRPGETLDAFLRSGWVNGLQTATIQARTIAGLPAISASASAGGWQFRLVLIQVGQEAYRFIFASARATAAFEQAAATISASFRILTEAERSSIRPLRVTVVTARAGDTVASLGGAMRGVADPMNLFLLLNGFDATTQIQPGTRVKLVVE